HPDRSESPDSHCGGRFRIRRSGAGATVHGCGEAGEAGRDCGGWLSFSGECEPAWRAGGVSPAHAPAGRAAYGENGVETATRLTRYELVSGAGQPVFAGGRRERFGAREARLPHVGDIPFVVYAQELFQAAHAAYQRGLPANTKLPAVRFRNGANSHLAVRILLAAHASVASGNEFGAGPGEFWLRRHGCDCVTREVGTEGGARRPTCLRRGRQTVCSNSV